MQISTSFMTNMYTTKVQPKQPTKISQTKIWDDMSPADQSQEIHQNAMRPLDMFDDRANNILNKILTDKGLSDEAIGNTKGRLFISSLIVDSNFNTHETQENTKEDTVKNIDHLIDNLMRNLKNNSFHKENKFLLDTARKLQTLYNADYIPLNIAT